jgi:transposase InsO family protein
LAWRLSNTLTTDFCIEAVQEALAIYGTPDIFNTDQGCQFTSQEFTGLLTQHPIAISMEGKGCWRDNVFVERLCKSVKYEEVYLPAYETISAAPNTAWNSTGCSTIGNDLTGRLTAKHRMGCTSTICPRCPLQHRP